MHYGMTPVGPLPPRNTASPVGWTFVPWAVTGCTGAYSKAYPVFILLSIHISCSPAWFILQVKLGLGWTKLAALKVNAAYSGLSHLWENCLNWTPKPVTFLGLVTRSKKELPAKTSVGQVHDDRKSNWFQSVGVHFLCDGPSLWSQFFVLTPF
jgi:hypothetical protein